MFHAETQSSPSKTAIIQLKDERFHSATDFLKSLSFAVNFRRMLKLFFLH